MITEKYLGYTIEVDQEDPLWNPREDSLLGTMLCNHRRYDLGDHKLESYGHSFENDFMIYLNKKYEIIDKDPEDLTEKDYIKIGKWMGNNIIYYELSLYDHSGISMKIGKPTDRFDSGLVGYIYTDKDAVRTFNNISSVRTQHVENARLILEKEVQLYSKYLAGDIYEYNIPVLYENCAGFDNEDAALQEAKNVIDSKDPEGKIYNKSIELYEECLDEFWDKYNKLKNELYNNEEDDHYEYNEGLLTELVGDHLKNY